MDEAQAIFRKKDIENLTHAIFEGAAWIMAARLHYIEYTTRNIGSVVLGTFGSKELSPYWAGFESQE
jgi:hypothetical protein